VLAVIVKHGDGCLIRVDEAGIVLPGEVCRFTAAQVLERIVITTQSPERTAVVVLYECEKTQVAAGDEVVACLCLFHVRQYICRA
jgi:hypothetical protein